jgi:methylenetetrahydrofolate dehydrogenase (NADP+)/methenyltetrahydrofolate cyclohydrolase
VSCNSKTPNLGDITRSADIIIIAIGQPGFLKKEMVTEKSIIIDVGSTFEGGVGRGDADYEELKNHVRAISPVPGGVGPMTVATLIENTWKAYQAQKSE